MRRPLVPIALSAAAGATLAILVESPPAIAAACAGIALVAAAAATRRERIAFLALGAFCIAWCRGEIDWRRPPDDDVARDLAEDSTLAALEGRVVEPPLVLHADFDQPPRRSTFVIEAARCALGSGLEPASGLVLVVLPGRAPRLDWGDRVRVHGRLHRPRRPRSPGAVDVARALRTRGIRAICEAEVSRNVSRIGRSPAWHPLRWIARLRTRFAESLSRALPERDVALAIALLLGERRDFPAELRESFQRCGTIHVLSISGLHVAILAGLARMVLGLFLASRPRALAASLIVFVLGYAILAGASPPVVRAAWMVVFYVGADLTGRRRDPLQALAAALLLLVMRHPPDLADLGFQLSFLSVASLVLLGPGARRTPAPAAWRWVRSSLGLSAAALLGTTPLVLFTFNLVAPASLVANLLVSAPVAAALGLGTVFLLASVSIPALLGPIAVPLAWSLDAVVAVPRLFEGLPFGHLYLPTPPLAAVLGAYAILGIVALSPHRTGFFVAGGALASSALVIVASIVRPAPPAEVAVLDVGQGSSVYLRTTSGATLLYDCGSSRFPQVGATVVAPFLWHRGVRRLDWLVLSHEDADHVNAAVSIAERITIGAVVVSPTFGADATSDGARVLARLESMGIPARRCARGDVLVAGEVVVLHPPQIGGSSRLPATDNDASLSLLVSTGGARVLLTGDLEAPGCEALVAESRAEELRCDYLVVPHHGARCEALPALLAASRPSEALVSARRRFASPRTFEMLESAEVPWSATFEEGTITRPLGR